ncbi:MAG: N-acetylmuramoyl-L-alanine amidase [Deltaproteobacteria bacterium]|nr:N-acetylmuramoyl-L-alanine amidase [Deltaproteobacteria bacterium]
MFMKNEIQVFICIIFLAGFAGRLHAASDYPGAEWIPACPTNYTSWNNGVGDIKYVVIHLAEGTYNGTISWFQNCDSQVSTHYVVSSDGDVAQMVKEKDIAWHLFNDYYGIKSIGIEHEGWVDEPEWFTDEMYKASAALVKYLCDKYKIPKTKAYILGHSEIPGESHTDPGPLWDWNYFMNLVTGGVVIKTGNLMGFVKEGDIYTGKAIAGAKVELQTGDTAYTDSNGLYKFNGLVEGEYEATASKAGYVTKSGNKYVAADVDNWMSIALDKVACQPACDGKECGSDTCGGYCGFCADGFYCDWKGKCKTLSTDVIEIKDNAFEIAEDIPVSVEETAAFETVDANEADIGTEEHQEEETEQPEEFHAEESSQEETGFEQEPLPRGSGGCSHGGSGNPCLIFFVLVLFLVFARRSGILSAKSSF